MMDEDQLMAETEEEGASPDLEGGEEEKPDQAQEEQAHAQDAVSEEQQKVLGIWDSEDEARGTIQEMYQRNQQLEQALAQRHQEAQRQGMSEAEAQRLEQKEREYEILNLERSRLAGIGEYAKADKLLADQVRKDAQEELMQGAIPQMMQGMLEQYFGPAIIQHRISTSEEFQNLDRETLDTVNRLAIEYGVPKDLIVSLTGRNRPVQDNRRHLAATERRRGYVESPSGANVPEEDRDARITKLNKSVMASWYK
jgi:hypothetical protein